MVLHDGHEVGNEMKFVLVFIVMLSFVIGLQSLAEPAPDQNQEIASDNARDEVQKIEANEIERSGQAYNGPRVGTKPLSQQNSGYPTVVECYTCYDCPKLLHNTSTRMCHYTLDPTKQRKCVAYTEQYSHTKSPVYIRGCASERGSCSDIRKLYSVHTDAIKLLSCQECEGDRCNSASLSLIDFTMAFLAMVVSPLIAKYTLS